MLGPVTAQDFVDALVLSAGPGLRFRHCQLSPLCGRAEDYYNYCVWRNNANNGTVAEDGTRYAIDAAGTVTLTAADGSTTTCLPWIFLRGPFCAVDEHTLTYTLNYDFPAF